MPANNVHVLKRLTDLSVRFPDEQPMIRGLFFPPKKVEFLSDKITKWNRANILRIDDAIMDGDSDLPTQVELVLDTDDTYTCTVYGARAMAKEISSRNADPSLDYEVERALMAKQRLSTLLEYQAVKLTLRSSGVMGASFESCAAAEQFSNRTSSSCRPVSKLRGIVLTIKTQTGGNPPNVGAMSSFTLNEIAMSEEFKDLSKFSKLVVADKDSGDGQLRILESLIGMGPGTLETTDAIYNSAKAGLAESNKQFIGSAVCLAYVTPPSIRTQGFGAGFQWGGFSDDPVTIIKVPQYNSGLIPGDEIRALSVVGYKPYNLVAGYTLDQAVDPATTGNTFLD